LKPTKTFKTKTLIIKGSISKTHDFLYDNFLSNENAALFNFKNFASILFILYKKKQKQIFQSQKSCSFLADIKIYTKIITFINITYL